MKELNLQEYGVSELNAEEMKTVDGGTMLIRLVAGTAGYALGLGYKFIIAIPAHFLINFGIGAY